MSASAIPKARIPRQIYQLNKISRGPAAVRLPPNVQSINLSFKAQNANGHMGPRKFWREFLPQVQFHNPNLPISVNRIHASTPKEHKTLPAILKVQFSKFSLLLCFFYTYY